MTKQTPTENDHKGVPRHKIKNWGGKNSWTNIINEDFNLYMYYNQKK